jgi:hypothetical protein
MPRFNRETGAISILRRDWFDRDRTVYQDCSTGVCRVVLSDGTVLHEGGANLVVGGNGYWACLLDGATNSLPNGVLDGDGRRWPGAGLGPMGPDGAYARKDAYYSYGPWSVLERDGRIWRLTDGDAADIQLLGDGRAVWTEHGLLVAFGLSLPEHGTHVWQPRAANVGDRWVLLYQDPNGGRLVLDGHVIGPGGNYYYLDLYWDGAQLHVCWSPNQADTDPQTLTLTLAALAALPKVGDVSPAEPVTFAPFDHPVLVAVFKDPNGESGAPAEIVVNKTAQTAHRPYFMAEDGGGPFQGELLGVYSESSTNPIAALQVAERLNTRLLLCHDSPEQWTLPSGLRRFDIPLVELYRYAGETLTQARMRWVSTLQSVLAQWPGDVGVAPQFYCMSRPDGGELWPIADVLDGLRPLTSLVNLSPRIKVVAPFSWQRGNGIVAHPELRAAFASLLQASPGLPTLTPIVTAPPPAPHPKPTPAPPAPAPKPATRFPAARLYGVHR